MHATLNRRSVSAVEENWIIGSNEASGESRKRISRGLPWNHGLSFPVHC